MAITPEIETRLNQLAEDLLQEDDLGAAVRAHIRIESVLNEFVKLALYHPKHLKKMNLDFDQSVSLALALGLVEELGPPLHAMGSLRNKFAHEIGTQLDQSKVTALYGTFSTSAKAQAQQLFNRFNEAFSVKIDRLKNLPIRDQFIVYSLVIWINIQIAVIQLRQETGRA